MMPNLKTSANSQPERFVTKIGPDRYLRRHRHRVENQELNYFFNHIGEEN